MKALRVDLQKTVQLACGSATASTFQPFGPALVHEQPFRRRGGVVKPVHGRRSVGVPALPLSAVRGTVDP